jgi:hypothetical protein
VLAARALPLWLIYGGMKLLLMLAAGYGMWRLLRDWLGFPAGLARLGGALFALNAQTQVVTIIHAVFNFAFPLVFVWALGRTPRGGRAWALAAAGLVLVSLVSYPVLTGPEFAALGVLLIVCLPPPGESRARLLARWVVFWVGYALVFLPLVWGLLGFKDESQRAYFPGTEGPLAVLVYQMREALAGSLLVALIGGALVLLPWSAAVRRALVVAAIPAALSALFNSTWANPLRATFVGALEPHLLFYVHGIALTVLALVGLRAALEHRDRLRLYLAGGALAFAVLAPWLLRASPWGSLFLLNVLVPLGVWLWLDGARWRLALVAAAIVGLVRVAVFHEGQENIAYRRFFHRDPALVARVAALPGRVVTLGFHPALGHHYGRESADGYSALFSGRYREVWREIVAPQLADPREAARFDWYFVEMSPLNGQTLRDFTHRLYSVPCPAPFDRPLGWRWPLLLALNVDTVLSLRPVPELEGHAARVIPGRCAGKAPRVAGISLGRLTRFFTPAPLWVYVLREPFPRGWAVDRADVLASDAEVLRVLGRRSVEELRTSVLLSAVDGHERGALGIGPPAPGAAPVAPPRARLTSYTPDRLVFEVETAGPAWLVVANNWSRHWRAAVDGAPAAVLRANHAFQAVRLAAAGRHAVVLEYRDPWLWATYAAVPLGLLTLVGVARPRGIVPHGAGRPG